MVQTIFEAETHETGGKLNLLRFARDSILLAGHIFYAGQACAASWENSFLFRLSTEYDSNPAMSPAYPGGAWRALLEPGYALLAKVGNNEFRAGLGIQLVRSSNPELDPDRDNPAAFLDWLRQSSTGDIGVSTRYTEVATRDSGVDATGRGPADSTRASSSVSGILSHQLTARSTASANGTYEEVSYAGGDFADYSMRSGGLRLDYALTELTTPFFRVSGADYVPANDGPSTGLTDVMLGLNWKTAHTDWTVQAGGAKVDDLKTIREGTVATQFTGQRTEVALNGGRTVLPSGLGGFVRADHARATWRYAFSEYDNYGIDVEGRKNLPVNFTGNGTSSAFSDIWMDHDFTSLWRMRIYYRLWNNRVDGSESATAHILGLSFSYNTAVSTPETQPNHD